MKVALSKIPGLLVTSLVAVLGIVALSSNEARPSETSMPSVAGAAASVKPSLVHTAVHDGPLVIETTLRNTSVGTSGSFDVTQRAKMLGCTSGTFEDRLTEPEIVRTFTCETGERSGTFTFRFEPWMHYSAPGAATRSWAFDSGSGDFAELYGAGDVYDPITGLAETFIGEVIHTSGQG